MIRQIEGESPRAFEAFRAYVEIGERRTQEQLAKKLKLKGRNSIAKWSVAYNWQQRLSEHLADEENARAEAQKKAALERAREAEKRRESISETAWDFAQQLFEKARVMLQYPLMRRETKDEEDKTVIINPVGWRMGDAAKMVETADALSRLAIGIPQRHTALTGPGGEPLPGAQIAIAPIIRLTLNETPETRRIKEAHGG